MEVSRADAYPELEDFLQCRQGRCQNAFREIASELCHKICHNPWVRVSGGGRFAVLSACAV